MSVEGFMVCRCGVLAGAQVAASPRPLASDFRHTVPWMAIIPVCVLVLTALDAIHCTSLALVVSNPSAFHHILSNRSK